MNPTVAVIIPCHNHEKWVVDAILSVAEQDYLDKFIVVVDDGSTDDSWRRIVEFCGLSSDFVDDAHFTTGKVQGTSVIAASYKKAGGPSFARNQGIKLAWNNANIFGFLDSDDIFLPGKISKSVEKMLDPQVGVVYSDYECFNPTTGVTVREYKPPYSRELLQRECIISCPSLVRKSILEKVGLFDESIRVAEDYDLWLRATEVSMAYHIPECLLRLRVGGHSSTATVPKEIWERSWHTVMSKLQARLNAAHR